MAAPKPRLGILDIEPYKGGNAGIDDVAAMMNLSANEAALGPSPRAVEAYRMAQHPIFYDDNPVKLRLYSKLCEMVDEWVVTTASSPLWADEV